MKLPGQLGEGDRNIPLAETSRSKMGSTLSNALTRIRKVEGVDPDRYPPVKSDIEYDTRRAMIGAEITARETAALILPAIHSTPALASNPSGGRSIKWLLTLILALVSATTAFSWLAYRETVDIRDRRNILRSQAEYLGRALMDNSKVKVKRQGPNFVIDYDWDLDESVTGTIRIPHKIPPEKIERLDQK
jgi:hypothetical protein